MNTIVTSYFSKILNIFLSFLDEFTTNPGLTIFLYIILVTVVIWLLRRLLFAA